MENLSLSQVLAEADPDKAGFVTKPVRGKRVKRKLRRKVYFILISLLLILSAGFYATYQVNKFFEEKHIIFRSPVVFQSPVRIEPRAKDEAPQVQPITEVKAVEVQALPVAPDPQLEREIVVPAAATSDIVYRIYRLESSAGKHDPCRRTGLYNGYGYSPGKCYQSHEQVTAIVTAWVEARADWPLAQMLCYYNTGKRLATCDYFKNYLLL